MPQDKIYTDGVILKAYKVDFPTDNPKKYRVSQEAKDFIEICLKYEMSDRPNPKEAY